MMKAELMGNTQQSFSEVQRSVVVYKTIQMLPILIINKNSC